MENTVASIRKEKKLTVAEMAILTGVSPMTIQRLENGTVKQVTPSVLDTFEEWGYNREEISAAYADWREYRVKELYSKVGVLR